LAAEARALASWRTPHVPAVLAVDEALGALLLEAVEPGTALADADTYPGIERMGSLLSALHASGRPAPSCPPVAARVASLFDSAAVHYRRRPDLEDLISRETYERGRELALGLARETPSAVLLHGDLTPVNVLEGGDVRGLVAIDPAACVGDPAFDAVDLILWRADDAGTIAARAEQLGPAIGAEASRILAWCSAFAGMVALEAAENGGAPQARLDAYVELALGA
jgi:streptomycin 6-kinase